MAEIEAREQVEKFMFIVSILLYLLYDSHNSSHDHFNGLKRRKID